jgi:hypothetical protein
MARKYDPGNRNILKSGRFDHKNAKKGEPGLQVEFIKD